MALIQQLSTTAGESQMMIAAGNHESSKKM